MHERHGSTEKKIAVALAPFIVTILNGLLLHQSDRVIRRWRLTTPPFERLARYTVGYVGNLPTFLVWAAYLVPGASLFLAAVAYLVSGALIGIGTMLGYTIDWLFGAGFTTGE